MANSQSIGVAYSDQDIIGANNIVSDNVLGYTTAAQGSVTQLTSKSTGVTLNKSAGRITMNNAALAGNTAVSFALTNSLISANDIIILNISGGAVADPTAYTAYVSGMGTSTATITLRNLTASSQSEAVVLNFALIHCL
ncbi:hypothetical protein UFOVP171_4 [uncultured Caudovirales phage]|uniref:Uncharacterized protein n=1 Tax=uncultured Caudovirales phage TaxID=2100421 RepID=A0A6J7WFU9_9CAUD|nr:hypothetical protein UFOVP171_4 [uncultured Caudovirales phage]